MKGATLTLGARRRALRCCAAGIALAILGASPSVAAEQIVVPLNFAEVVPVDKPVATLVIGNPGVVEATLPDSQTIILTAKKAGATNVIAFAEDGTRLEDLQVQVLDAEATPTLVFNGPMREAYTCGTDCTLVGQTLSPGAPGAAAPGG